ncbi:MAG: hypothetical protein JST00_07565 [Deltaproteobacteria bacterium]|nr:hypothetical protein [Deltaproteobacteria bacterium]
MRSPAWLVLLLGVPALAVSALDVTACTSFSGEPEDAGVAGDGTVTPGPDVVVPDATPPDGAMPMTCPGGGPPVTFVPVKDKAEPPSAPLTGTVNIVDDPNGPTISAEGVPPMGTTTGLRAFATWKRRDLSLTTGTGTLDYDLDVSYLGDRVFTQSGCTLELNGPDAGEASVKLRFESDGTTTFEGREPNGGGSSVDYAQVPLTTGVTKPIDTSVQVRLAFAKGKVTVTVALLGVTATRELKAPTPIQVVTLKCGIDYADNSDGKLLQVKTRRVRFSFCPDSP